MKSIWQTLKEMFLGGKRLQEQLSEAIEVEAAKVEEEVKEVVAKVKKPRAPKAPATTKKTSKK